MRRAEQVPAHKSNQGMTAMSAGMGMIIRTASLYAVLAASAAMLAACTNTKPANRACATATTQPAYDASVTGSINKTVPEVLPIGTLRPSLQTMSDTQFQFPPAYPQKNKKNLAKSALPYDAATITAIGSGKFGRTFSLVFPENGYTLANEQLKRLSKFVEKLRAGNKKVKVISFVGTKKNNKHVKAPEKDLREANRRAKATAMFLRIYGLASENIAITTTDESRAENGDPRQVNIVVL